MSLRYDKLVTVLKGRLPDEHLDSLGRAVAFIVRLREVRASAFVWSVVDPSVLEAQGEAGFVLADAGTGPWRFTEFDPATQFAFQCVSSNGA